MTKEPRRKGRPRAFSPDPSQTTIQALDRALDVLDVLARTGGLTLTGIATELGQSPATLYRALATLEARGIVEAGADQTWHIGPAAFRLGSAFLRRSSVVERSRGVMRELMEATGETANLGIERGGEVIFVSQVETSETIRAFFPPGTQSPIHASGIGKALLATWPEARVERMLRRTLESYTPNTIAGPEALRAELARIRAEGFAHDDEERAEGMRCVAGVIFDMYGEAVAGISVSGPTQRLSADRVATTGALVRESAAKVSRMLGAPEPLFGGVEQAVRAG